MRQHGRRAETYTTAKRSVEPMSENWATRVYNETQIRANRWSKAHHGREMSPVSWNALWERVRNELYGEQWRCQVRRAVATEVVWG